MKISHVNEIRNLDRRAIDKYGITQEILMENAGQAAYFTILKEFGIKNKNFVTFCGVGHNGGDGLVVTRKIYSNGGLSYIATPANLAAFTMKGYREEFNSIIEDYYHSIYII